MSWNSRETVKFSLSRKFKFAQKIQLFLNGKLITYKHLSPSYLLGLIVYLRLFLILTFAKEKLTPPNSTVPFELQLHLSLNCRIWFEYRWILKILLFVLDIFQDYALETNLNTRLFQFLRYLCTPWCSNLLIYVLLFFLEMDSIVIPDDTNKKPWESVVEACKGSQSWSR